MTAPVVSALVALIEANGWQDRFELAVRQLRARRIADLDGIRTLGD